MLVTVNHKKIVHENPHAGQSQSKLIACKFAHNE